MDIDVRVTHPSLTRMRGVWIRFVGSSSKVIEMNETEEAEQSKREWWSMESRDETSLVEGVVEGVVEVE